MFVRVDDPTPAHHYQPGPRFPLKCALGVLPSIGLDKCIMTCTHHYRASQVALVVKNPPANAGDIGDGGSIFESGRAPGGGHDNSFQCSFLENPMDRGAWRAIVHSPQSQKELDMTKVT